MKNNEDLAISMTILYRLFGLTIKNIDSNKLPIEIKYEVPRTLNISEDGLKIIAENMGLSMDSIKKVQNEINNNSENLAKSFKSTMITCYTIQDDSFSAEEYESNLKFLYKTTDEEWNDESILKLIENTKNNVTDYTEV